LDSIVKAIAINLSLGGRYAEEICLLSGVEKNKEIKALSDEDLERLFKAFFMVYSRVKYYKDIKPCVSIINDEAENFAPFEFESMKGKQIKYFENFNDATDYYYSLSQKDAYMSGSNSEFENRYKQLEFRLKQQEDYAIELENKSKELSELGNVIFRNHVLFNNILSKLREANKLNRGWEEINAVIESEKSRGIYEANCIERIDTEKGIIYFIIEGKHFGASINSDSSTLMNEFFSKSKKMKSKIQGTMISAVSTRRLIDELKAKGVEHSQKIDRAEKEDKKWFEKYRWMKTSSNFLLVAGKDATQNEILIKKVAEDNDLIFHTSIAGSPFGVLKDGLNAPEIDKKECAQFILAFSRAYNKRTKAGF
jgi:predicted ribosome quality control (RQC) complex YloA/Tae2 family protein